MGSVLGVVVGPTVGNRPDGSPGDVPVPESGGSVTGGSAMPVAGSVADVVGEVAGFVTTTSVAESLKDSDLLAVALALSWTCSPLAASWPTRTLTCSSSAWPTARLPTLHVVPSRPGQTVNVGA